MLGALAVRRKSHIRRHLIFPNGIARVVQLQNFGGLPVDVVLERLGELLLLGGELANDLIRVDIGRSRSGDRRGARGLVLVGGPDRQTQRRKHSLWGESMLFPPLKTDVRQAPPVSLLAQNYV